MSYRCQGSREFGNVNISVHPNTQQCLRCRKIWPARDDAGLLTPMPSHRRLTAAELRFPDGC